MSFWENIMSLVRFLSKAARVSMQRPAIQPLVRKLATQPVIHIPKKTSFIAEKVKQLGPAVATISIATAGFFLHDKYDKIKREKQTIEHNKNKFTQIQRETAAKWWAQYLPKEINEYVHGQYNLFIKILADKMLTIKLDEYGDFSFIRLGDSSSYDSPHIVDEALKEAGINFPSFGNFPYNTEMRLYDNGHILVHGNVIRTNPAFEHYDNTTSFNNAPFMKITGDKIRIVEIPLTAAESLYAHHIHLPDQFRINSLKSPWDSKEEVISKIYTAIHLRDFTKSEEEFLKLSNDDWIAILQDKKRLQEIFKKGTFIYYRKNINDILKNTEYGHIGKVTLEKIGENYYQHSTGVVRVKTVPQEGTIGHYDLTKLSPGDFLIKRSLGMNYLAGDSSFVAKLCDAEGNEISDKIYQPGKETELPMLDKPVAVEGVDSRRKSWFGY